MQISKNRYVLAQIINCIKFCGAFELALRGHDEKDGSANPGIFRGLINFTAELDSALKEHMSEATVFRGTSKDIQNDLLQCMLEVCHEKIKEEIERADYVSVIADETSDVSSLTQMVIVLRYLLSNGKPVERFWTFVNPKNCDAVTLSSCVKDVLSVVITDKDKLISQSYDGASVMSGEKAGVNALIKQDYPHAHYVHCYAHKLNLIMAQATSQNTQVRIFFADINEIPAFFSNSPQRVRILDEIVGKRFPGVSNIRWNFKSRLVETVYEHQESLVNCLEEIEEHSKQSSTIAQARGLLLRIQQPVFLFWLKMFHLIMPHVDLLYNQLQNRQIDSVSANAAISAFEENIHIIRQRVDMIEENPHPSSEPEKKRKRETPEMRKIAAKEVCDTVIVQAKERFKFTGHLTASMLFLTENFNKYNKEFPEPFLKKTHEAYPFIDIPRLRTELQIIYMRKDFSKTSSASVLLQFIIENNLERTFSESLKLLKILVTIPMTSSEAERCFSTLKRVKTFLRSTMGEDRLTALAMLSIEKKLISDIDNFNERVIDKFAQKKDRRMDFLHHHTV